MATDNSGAGATIVPVVQRQVIVPVESVLTETPVQDMNGTEPVPTVEWGLLLIVLWLAGGLAVLLWQVIVYLRARSRVMKNAVLLTDYEALAKELCPGRTVHFFRVNGLDTPMTLGVFRPAVLLPEGEVRSAAVRHELIHIRRWDVAWKYLLLLSCAVHWFNPLVWIMSRRADRDMEAGCDGLVMAGGDAAGLR